MIKITKAISLVLISLFCLFLLLLFLKQILPLEYADSNSEFFFDNVLFFGFPIAILLTLPLTLKKKDTVGSIFAKIIFTILIMLVVLFLIAASALSNMCGWSTEAVLFQNKQNSSLKIATRSFGCGATDSGSTRLEVFKIRPITPYFIWATKTDTTTIDKSKWIRIIKTSE